VGVFHETVGRFLPAWAFAVGAFLVGITLLNEPVNAMRIAAATLIVSGLVLMKLSSP
jgi:multidrug transporter EmrE-like cation transporter